MDDIESDSCLMAAGVDSFRDLLKGNIDIIEYLNSAPGSVSGGVGGSFENIYEDESKQLSKMEINSLLGMGNNGNGVMAQQAPQHHMQQQQQQQMHQHQLHQQIQNGNGAHLPPPPPRLHHHVPSSPMLHTATSGLGRSGQQAGGVYGGHRNSQDRPPSYDQHVVRLPDSPPETDSGAGSAGSPSGSEASPYSPEFQQYHHLHRGQHAPPQHIQHHLASNNGGPGGHVQQGGVIRQPVVNQQQQANSNGVVEQPQAVSQQCRSASDVILNVHNLDHLTQAVVTDYLPVQASSARVPTHMNSHWSQSNDYFTMSATGQANVINENAAAPSSRSMANGQQQQPPQQSPHVTTPVTPNPNYTPYALPAIHAASPYMSGDNSLHRKRARTETGAAMVKPEPNSPTGRTSEESLFYDESFGGNQQAIRFSEFQKENWFALCNMNGREMQPLGFAVVADKGFNYSHFDTAFVNQKKNHFQVSVHIEVRDPLPPKFVRVPTENGGATLKPISEFQLDFFGVKAELLSSYIQIKQSQTDRKPISYEPVKLDLPPNRVTKVTVARLHFSETTMNNQRKNGRPNPDQKYFYLIASLNAVVQGNEKYTIAAYSSERVIVRASNPGQFDNGDGDTHWQKGQTPGSIFHPGPVGVGTDKPSTALSVMGDISCTGTVYHPSDARLKQNIQEVNYADALSKVSQLRVVQYEIRPEIADEWGLPMEERQRVGVIAQEVEEIIPDAVRENGDYLTVDDNRIFYESAAAVKELCRLTGNLEYKIEEVEKISKKLSRLSYLKRLGSLRSTDSVNTCNSSKVPESGCGASYISCSQSSIAGTLRRDRSSSKGKSKNDDDTGEKVEFRRERSRSKHRHHHHHCTCRRLSFGYDRRGPCSNKVIQSTVIILVIVMAFCLLSMATLYILDWHKRNVQQPLASSLGNGQVGHQQHVGTSTSSGVKGGSGVGPGLMALNNAKSATGRTPSLYNPFVLHPPPYKQPSPLHPSCVKLPCVEFCCPNSYTYYSIGDEDISTWNLPPVGTKFEDKLLNAVSTKLKQFKHRETSSLPAGSRIEKRRAKLDYISSAVAQSNHQSNHDVVSNWRAFEPPNQVKIRNLNETIDSRYCLENTCSDPKRGNFTFYIPVSKYMPHIPLDIEFGITNKEIVQYCAKWTGEVCYGVEEVYKEKTNNENVQTPPKNAAPMDVQQKRMDTWELPIGTYQTSTYRFRVGGNSMLCSLPDDEAGVSYVEYNMHFFRTCL